jgi:hypothetical protein
MEADADRHPQHRDVPFDANGDGFADDAHIIFSGVVNNPIGMTDVFAAAATSARRLDLRPGGLIRTDSFKIEAVLGDIGINERSACACRWSSRTTARPGADHYRTADAGQAVFLELRGLLRRDLVGSEATTGFVVDIDRVRSGQRPRQRRRPRGPERHPPAQRDSGRLRDRGAGDRRSSTRRSIRPGRQGFRRGPPSSPTTFRQSPGTTPTIYPRGVFGAGNALVDVDYVFGQAFDPNRLISSGDDINIVGPAATAGPFVAVSGFTDIRANGWIDVLTNGHITLTEVAGDFASATSPRPPATST